MAKKLTAKKTLKLLKKAVTVRGANYVDPSAKDMGGGCIYFGPRYAPDPNSPCCIVGVVASQSGIDEFVTDLLESNSEGVSYVVSGNHYLTDKAVEVLSAAQAAQDRGKTWGEAYEAAKKAAEEYVPYRERGVEL